MKKKRINCLELVRFQLSDTFLTEKKGQKTHLYLRALLDLQIPSRKSHLLRRRLVYGSSLIRFRIYKTICSFEDVS